jgi:hypothetical protein
VCIHMLVNMLITLTVTLSNTFQVLHITWMEFAFSYQFKLGNKDNVSQWHDDLCNGDLP